MTSYGTDIDHIWTNATTQQYMFGCVEAYWTDHKSILFAFKLCLAILSHKLNITVPK